AGTLSGNPIAVTAGLAMLSLLKEGGTALYERLEQVGKTIAESLRESARNKNVPVIVNQVGSMLTVFFTEAHAVADYTSAKTSDTVQFAKWFRALLEQGIYFPPSQFEAAFLSAILTDSDIELLTNSARSAFQSLASH
ncbi:MAG: aminotransferase class III-fold pyridoxal phosphate-dependent enzyme, partial [Armatimonadetes bacterium]|nr:aminotransferase class III-fold pyridoxal phosphate-dependent enzyme [Armatimonadota bacterium]